MHHGISRYFQQGMYHSTVFVNIHVKYMNMVTTQPNMKYDNMNNEMTFINKQMNKCESMNRDSLHNTSIFLIRFLKTIWQH